MIEDKYQTLRNSDESISSLSAIHSDIYVNLKEEVEKITWTYRNAGEFMTTEQLKTLLEDIQKYKRWFSGYE